MTVTVMLDIRMSRDTMLVSIPIEHAFFFFFFFFFFVQVVQARYKSTHGEGGLDIYK